MSQAPNPPLPRRLLLGVCAGVLLLAAGGYLWTGSPQLAFAPPPEAAPTIGPEQINAMVERLAQRLKDKPDDAEGWGMLGRSYVVLGRHPEAIPAYRRALALTPDDPALLADAADALAVVAGRKLDGEPLALVNKALKIAPDNLKALSLAGSAAFDRGDFAGAVKHWEHVLAVAPPDSPWLPRVRESIAEARAAGGLPPAPMAAAQPMPGAPAQPPAATAANASISGRVTLAAALRAKAAPEDTVFVYARAAEGPRMPLAIVRKQVKDLPFDFRLDDSLAMSPANKLSMHPQVIVSARVSKSGSAMPQPGDLAGDSTPQALGTQGLVIEIARVVAP